MNKPVFLTSVLVGLIIIFIIKLLSIGLAVILGGTIMAIVLSNVSNSTFGIYDDDDDEFDKVAPKKDSFHED